MELPDTHNPSRDQMSKEDIKRCQLQLKLQRELNHLSTSPAEVQRWSWIQTKLEENKHTPELSTSSPRPRRHAPEEDALKDLSWYPSRLLNFNKSRTVLLALGKRHHR